MRHNPSNSRFGKAKMKLTTVINKTKKRLKDVSIKASKDNTGRKVRLKKYKRKGLRLPPELLISIQGPILI